MEVLHTIVAATSGLGQNIPHLEANAATRDNILNAIYVVLGALAVIFIIIGGIRYTLAAGDASKVARAKSTILYAVIGLVIAILAFAITNFVLSRVDASSFTALRDSVVNTLLYVGGAIAIIMIIFGGFRYVTSNGDAAAIKQAKNTIFGAVIGLIVSILAFAIVNFVLARL